MSKYIYTVPKCRGQSGAFATNGGYGTSQSRRSSSTGLHRTMPPSPAVASQRGRPLPPLAPSDSSSVSGSGSATPAGSSRMRFRPRFGTPVRASLRRPAPTSTASASTSTRSILRIQPPRFRRSPTPSPATSPALGLKIPSGHRRPSNRRTNSAAAASPSDGRINPRAKTMKMTWHTVPTSIGTACHEGERTGRSLSAPPALSTRWSLTGEF